MRIAYLAAGAGAMYCGACARDATLARGLLARGHDVQLIPLYTPLKLEAEGLPVGPIFYGGINVVLQQAWGLFRWLPRALDRVLDRPSLLRQVAKYAIEVEARNLGPMTVSVLAGTDGRQKKEVERLLEYLAQGFRPELINLTNSLLSGIAPEIKRRLKVPVVCTFQGEDSFVADLPEPHQAQARSLIQANARAVDLFICPSAALAPQVAEFLGVPPERLRVIRTAMTLPPELPRPAGEFTVGYLSVIRPCKGLDLLVEALRLLRRQDRPVRLLVAGRVMHQPFWKTLQRMIQSEGLQHHTTFLGEVDAAGKGEFLRRCHAFCVPSRIPEPRGVAVLEAMAAGVPVIVPASGVYPELLADGGGGVLVRADDAGALAAAVGDLMDHPRKAAAMARQARQVIAQHCAPEQMVAQTVAVYEGLVAKRS